MNKVTLKIDGMACNMCEAHVTEALRKAFKDAKEVKASHTNKEATFLTESDIDLNVAKNAINEEGYTYIDGSIEPYEKKKLFGMF